MTMLRNLSTLVLLFVCLTTGTTPAHAQEAPSPLYLRLDYMNVEPANTSEYIDLEQQIWKPIHQELIKAGNLVGWNLYVVQFPGGTENGYNFVTVNFYDDLADLETPFPEDIFTRVHAGAEVAELVGRTYAARDLVRSELWVLIDQVMDTAATDTPSAPSRYTLVDYMRVQPGGEAEYISHEQDIWKAVHQERMKAGKINSWGVYALMFPGGTTYEYNYGTANVFDSLTAFEDFYPEDILKRNMPNYSDMPALVRRISSVREVVRSELWELIDHTE